MFNSETLEVGIGMSFLFLLMSLICAGIKEWLEGIFKWRALDLERALRTLLDDPSGHLTAHLYAHPLVSSLYQGHYRASDLQDSKQTRWMTGGANARHMALTARRNLPSYIPAAQFATALIDLVGRGPTDVDGESAPHAPLTIAQLRERSAALSSNFLRRAFLSALDHSQGDLHQLKENLQHWFDGSMDRASGWYKRRTQAVLFVLGFVAAGVLNVDALYVMGRLTSDKAFREAVVTAAGNAEAPGAAASAASSAGSLAAAREARLVLDQIGMPMGWHDDEKDIDWWAPVPTAVQMCKASNTSGCDDSGYSWFRMLLGWLITAFAVMLGAPFWFDVLNKFMVIRSTVKPREKSREEGSEDRAGTEAGVAAAATVIATPTASSEVVAEEILKAAPQPFVAHEWRKDFVNQQEVQL